MRKFLQTLKEQRWDDHRYYHHSRINQTLHLLSAGSFLCAYLLVFKQPVIAVMLGWAFGMTSRQMGHFFFEPRDYDDVNNATHDHKEEIKVGYNLQRKVVLMSIWILSPLVLVINPTLFGIFPHPRTSAWDFVHDVATMWLVIGVGGLLFRTIHLFFLKDVVTGLAWMTKILTDPFHDIMLYYKAPLYLMRGELIDPMHHVQHSMSAGSLHEAHDASDKVEDDGFEPATEGA